MKGWCLAILLVCACDKPACKQLESTLCAPDVGNPIACQAARGMSRQSSNGECAEALADLDLTGFTARKPVPAPPAEPPKPAPEAHPDLGPDAGADAGK